MESSKLIIDKLIILRHLKVLESDGKRMASFKKTLCQQKPPRGAGTIKMENLKDKSIEEIIDFIFRCHTERHGASTIKKVLKEISENQIRLSIERELRNARKNSQIIETNINEATQCSKNLEPEKNEGPQPQVSLEQGDITNIISHTVPNKQIEVTLSHVSSKAKASQTKVIKVKQDVNQEYKIAAITLVPVSDAAPCSQPPTKKIKADQEEDAVPGPSNHKEAPASKNEGHRPAPSPLTKGPQVSLGQGDITNIISHTVPNKQIEVTLSHVSSKEPKSQVNPIQGNITSNISHGAPEKQITVALSRVSSMEPQPQVTPRQGSITESISHIPRNKQLGAAPSHASSTEHLQFEKSPPNTSMEKEIGKIMVTHLKRLGEKGINKFKETLCLVEPPFAGSKIQTRHIKDKSLEEMVDVIISRQTMKHAQATVEKVLDQMGESQINMLITKDISKKVPCLVLKMGSAERVLPTIKKEKKTTSDK